MPEGSQGQWAKVPISLRGTSGALTCSAPGEAEMDLEGGHVGSGEGAPASGAAQHARRRAGAGPTARSVFAVLGSGSFMLFARGSQIIPLVPTLSWSSVSQPCRAALTACSLEMLGKMSSSRGLEGSSEQLLRAQRASSRPGANRDCAHASPGGQPGSPRCHDQPPEPRASVMAPTSPGQPWSHPPTRLPRPASPALSPCPHLLSKPPMRFQNQKQPVEQSYIEILEGNKSSCRFLTWEPQSRCLRRLLGVSTWSVFWVLLITLRARQQGLKGRCQGGPAQMTCVHTTETSRRTAQRRS